MSQGTADVGVIGLGVMGAALARNFHSRGRQVAVYNRDPEVLQAFIAEHGDERFFGSNEYAAFVAAIARPRKIVLMVTAGRAVDAVIDALAPHLEEDDIVIDGGNSLYSDTDRRLERAASEPWRFVGMGVSGGEEGARLGPAMMPGGDESAWEEIRPLLEEAAAVSDTGPCVGWCGSGSAGHFVKMVHNGIEYGDMQLIAEIHDLLRRGLGRTPVQTREVFSRWNDGPLSSFLIEITAGIVAAKDPQGEGPLLEQILDKAGQKGTGRWTAIAAIEAGVPLSTIVSAVDARVLSSLKSLRADSEAAFTTSRGRLDGITEDDLEEALYAAKVLSYTQGFALLRQASETRGYGVNLAGVARIWKAGCIIRAAFLDDVYTAFDTDPELPLLMLDTTFQVELAPRILPWRRVVAAATLAGIPVPALSASLGWFDTMTHYRGTANLIQAQRDWFGAHTYRRVDDPETPVHSDWASLEQL
jgi:6-phosphogluconate dehydrogenase